LQNRPTLPATAALQLGNCHIISFAPQYFQAIFAAVDGNGLGARLGQRLDNSVGVITLVVNNQNYY
jgi:hypothetical protein